MTGKVEASLKQLSSLAKTLNEASDELSRQITALESALNSYNLGVWVWVKEPILTETELSEPDGEGHRYEVCYVHQLGYGKHKGKWGLVVGSFWDADPEEGQLTFLRDASREIRLKAMDRVPDLLEALAKELAVLTDEASKKAAEAKELSSALTKRAR